MISIRVEYIGYYVPCIVSTSGKTSVAMEGSMGEMGPDMIQSTSASSKDLGAYRTLLLALPDIRKEKAKHSGWFRLIQEEPGL